MDNYVLRALCDERHKNSDENTQEIKASVESLREEIKSGLKDIYNRQNWFYLVAIGALASALATVFR